ncbi:MAG: glycosyltransferase family 4 protein [Acidimicrobiia bacterium]|nr:glycosyltransferase family 4 protein [Acidimicrobiia bacterium]
MDPLRVLVVGMSWFDERPGGLNRYLHDLTTALEGAGAEPFVVAAGQRNGPRGHGRSVASPDPVRKLLGLRAAAQRAAAHADVIDVHFAFHGAAALTAAAVRRLPLVVHFQGPWADEGRTEGAGRAVTLGRRSIERSVYRRAARIVTLTHAFAELVVDRYGVDPERVVVLRPGVDTARFSPGDRVAARERFGVNATAPVAVCVRRLARRMGIDVLLRCWAEVVAAVPAAQLLVVGDGAERANLERLAARLAPDNVTFLGRVADNNLPLLYQAADLSVVPTVALEGFGLITLESLACGTPVVVTDAAGLAEVPRLLDPSSVVPTGDAAALAERVLSALNGSAPLPSPERCRTFALDYDWARVADRHIELYRSVSGTSSDRTVPSGERW